MLDRRVQDVLGRLEEQDRRERDAGLPPAERSRQIPPATGRFLFALAAAQAGISVLEVGASRGYSSIWLAAGTRVAGGRVVSLEHDPRRCAEWRANVGDAGLVEWAELVEGDAFEILRATQDTFDLVFLDAEKEDYEALFWLSARLLEPGGLVVADNVLSHADALAAYSEARQSDARMVSVTVPLDRGLEVTSLVSELPDEVART